MRFTNTVNDEEVLILNPQEDKYPGQVPFGFDFQGSSLVVNPIEQKTIEMIYKLRSSKRSLREIAQELNRQFIPTKNKNRWQANTVKKILDRQMKRVCNS